MKNNLTERVLKTIKNYDMVRAGDSVLVCVSGGPDSVYLLHALARLKKKLALNGLFVANLDHGLRGSLSEEASRFVRDLSAELGMRCVHKKVKLKELRSKKISTEELAREVRYKFFFRFRAPARIECHSHRP